MNTPVSLDDVVAGEWLWAASKATLSGAAILVVITAMGFVSSPLALWTVPVIFITGLCFAALGLIVTALSPSFDFFMYYFTLIITPMTLLSGVFFPFDQLPSSLQVVASWLPLTHAVAIVRPLLLLGEFPTAFVTHVAFLLAVSLIAFWIALILFRRRLLR